MGKKWVRRGKKVISNSKPSIGRVESEMIDAPETCKMRLRVFFSGNRPSVLSVAELDPLQYCVMRN